MGIKSDFCDQLEPDQKSDAIDIRNQWPKEILFRYFVRYFIPSSEGKKFLFHPNRNEIVSLENPFSSRGNPTSRLKNEKKKVRGTNL